MDVLVAMSTGLYSTEKAYSHLRSGSTLSGRSRWMTAWCVPRPFRTLHRMVKEKPKART